jgi:hypothetical protein
MTSPSAGLSVIATATARLASTTGQSVSTAHGAPEWQAATADRRSQGPGRPPRNARSTGASPLRGRILCPVWAIATTHCYGR